MARKKDVLMKALAFSTKDMGYNRQGQMSPRQQERFMRVGRWRALGAAVLGGVSAGVIAQATQEVDVWTFYAAQVLNALVFGWATWARNMRLFKDAAGGHVTQLVGKATVGGERGKPVLYIGDKAVLAGAQVTKAVEPRKTYCAYVAPNSGRLLALEPKSAPPSSRRRSAPQTPRFGSRR